MPRHQVNRQKNVERQDLLCRLAAVRHWASTREVRLIKPRRALTVRVANRRSRRIGGVVSCTPVAPTEGSSLGNVTW